MKATNITKSGSMATVEISYEELERLSDAMYISQYAARVQQNDGTRKDIARTLRDLELIIAEMEEKIKE